MSRKTVTVNNLTRRTVLAQNAQIADTTHSRRQGLLGRAGLDYGEGLVITGGNRIHTNGMAFAIDVIFVNKAGQVTRTVEGVGQGRWESDDAATAVIELPAGVIHVSGTVAGDQLELHE